MLKRHWKLSVTLALVLLAVLSVVGYQIFVTGRETHVWLEPTGLDPAAGTVSGDLVVDPGWQYGEVLQADLHADNETYPVPLARREDGPIPARSRCRWARGPSGWSSRRTGETRRRT